MLDLTCTHHCWTIGYEMPGYVPSFVRSSKSSEINDPLAIRFISGPRKLWGCCTTAVRQSSNHQLCGSDGPEHSTAAGSARRASQVVTLHRCQWTGSRGRECLWSSVYIIRRSAAFLWPTQTWVIWCQCFCIHPFNPGRGDGMEAESIDADVEETWESGSASGAAVDIFLDSFFFVFLKSCTLSASCPIPRERKHLSPELPICSPIVTLIHCSPPLTHKEREQVTLTTGRPPLFLFQPSLLSILTLFDKLVFRWSSLSFIQQWHAFPFSRPTTSLSMTWTGHES